MHQLTLPAAIVALLVAPSSAYPPTSTRVTGSNGLLQSYDYVVVGGGTSGLTVANRLSEDSGTTVLVIEAGELDQGEDIVEIPGLAGGAVGTKYDWNVSYVANPDAANRSISIPLGKVVGGSSLLNRMLFHRGSAHDYDQWEELGNSGWNWSTLLPFFKKSERWTPPNEDVVNQWNVTFDTAAHGTKGRVSASYSPWWWPATRNYIEASQELGINIPQDGMNGEAYGGYYPTHAQDSKTVTRTSARKAYYDTAKSRQNYHLLTGNRVTKVVVKNGAVTAVEFASSPAGPKQSVSVGREAIMAAGSIHTPQILQLSGIGDAALLQKFNITPVADLPAVGQNFHDHTMVAIVHNVNLPITASNLTSNTTWAAEQRAIYDSQKTGPYSSATGDFILFLPAQNFTDASASLVEKAKAQGPSDFLAADTPDAVVKGYAARHKLLTDTLSATDAATVEFIPSDGTMIAALLHPFSRGSVKLRSVNPFDAPLADSAFLRNPVDAAILVEAVKFIRKFFETSAFESLAPLELVPGSNVTTDAQIESFIRSSCTTVFHPVGTCSMGPKEEGGCVDAELKVYGISGLRVVDGSVMPLVPAAHTMGTVYAVAEKAADLIKKSRR